MINPMLRVAGGYNVWIVAIMLPFLLLLVGVLSVRYATTVKVNQRFRVMAMSTLVAAVLEVVSTLVVDGWGKSGIPPFVNLLLRSVYYATVNVNAYHLMRYVEAYVDADDKGWDWINRLLLLSSFVMLVLNLLPGIGGFFFSNSFIPGETGLLKGPYNLFCRSIYGFYYLSAAFYLQVTHRQAYSTRGQYFMMNALWCLLIAFFIMQYFFFRGVLLSYVGVTLIVFAVFFCYEAPAYRQMLQSEKELREAGIEADVFTRFAEDSKKAKGDFLANTSHEIRTPMNAILGMNEVILKECRDDEVRRASLNIRKAGNNLLFIINNILDISRAEFGNLELYNDDYHLWQLLLDVQDSVSEIFQEKCLNFVLDADKSLPEHLYGDVDRLRQILTNLVDNAVKYTEKGSVTLSIRGEREETSRRVNLQIAVTDTGMGIREEDLGLLFQTFARVNLSETQDIQGAGLGLTLARYLLELMGGHISVESEYGRGSTFTVTLTQELAKGGFQGTIQEYEDRTLKEAEVEDEGAFTCPNAHLLVVDDAPVNLAVVRGMLGDTKAQVDTAGSGEDCLHMMREKHYDVVFLDHRMPGMDGFETLDKAREMKEGQGVVYIILTANAAPGLREEYMSYGFNDYLPKPMTSDMVHRLLAHYLPENLKIKA